MATKLSDYIMIGNTRSGALINNQGSIDWCCLPQFDSPAIFAAILDGERGGHFSITPTGEYTSDQCYIPNTNVAETNFDTANGSAKLTDTFTVNTEEANLHSIVPDHEILRVIEGISGFVDITVEFAPKIFYGRDLPRLEDKKKMGFKFSWNGHICTLLSTLGALKIEDAKITANFKLQQGERFFFSLSYSGQSPSIVPELKHTAWGRLQNTIAYWRNWIGNCNYKGLYEEHVKRSALALKLLTYSPSGAIIAAPTTSLPEELGGERNWDYRYCWLRDASFTIRALISLGYTEEAHAYMNWILHSTRLTRPRLQVVYSVFGRTFLEEKKLTWLKGYRDSRPVRVGNDAHNQFQLDIYGEVLDALYTYSQIIDKFDRSTKKFILGLGQIICKLWDKPDNSIWENRNSPVHHTYSKVMAWVGLDRLMKLAERFQWQGASINKFSKTASRIKEKIEEEGYNYDLKSYTSELNGDTLDASLLMISLVGYCSSVRMESTVNLINDRLSANNLIYRYKNTEDGLSGDEGAFGICNFWLAENFAKTGELEKAKIAFDSVIENAGPSGLLSEESDPETKELLGNYPQGFTHIGLINAALTINEAHVKQNNS